MNEEPIYKLTLDFERGVNEEYGRSVHKRREDDARMVAQISSINRNTQWLTGSAKMPGVTNSDIVVIGRVSIDHIDDDLGNNFYIGTTYSEIGKTLIVNWNARIAELYFLGTDSADVLASTLLGRRSFHVANDDLTAYFDELESAVNDQIAFPLTLNQDFQFPRPQKAARPVIARGVVNPGTPTETPWSDQINDAPTARSQLIPKAAEPELIEPKSIIKQQLNIKSEPPLIRTPDAVIHAINQPRRGHLSAVLSTLQPDQYRLVTWPSNQPLIVQGQPGTGKTIIALHRAVFLTHEESEFKHDTYGPLRLTKVALIGPTDIYSNHVKNVQNQLGGNGFEIISVESLLASILDVAPASTDMTTSSKSEYMDTRWILGDYGVKAVSWWRKHQPNVTPSVKMIVDSLTKPTLLRDAVVDNAEFAEYFNSMKNWDYAITKPNYWPFLAMVSISIKPLAMNRLYSHIFVDEAQDIDPLRWRIIDKFLGKDSSLSIFGDMNQRRSDFSYSSWTELATDLQISDENGIAPVYELQTIYRSTRRILAYASRLLPKNERSIVALREGIDPTIIKVIPKEIHDEAARQIEKLLIAYPSAINAIITINPQEQRTRLQKKGWGYDSRESLLSKDDLKIRILRPDQARGLEFDGVVVVEPIDFPKNIGRQGALYTSLTRANQELVVVHSKPLPQELKIR